MHHCNVEILDRNTIHTVTPAIHAKMDSMTTSPLPTSQQAVVQSKSNPGGFEISSNRPLPIPSPSQVLIKVSAVALNHCDWKMPTRVPCPGAVNGADFSGTIVRLGESISVNSGLKMGDRVAGAQMASSRRRPWVGAFTQYITEEADSVWLVPETLSWEEAASIGCAVTSSVGMALWVSLKLVGTPEDPTPESKYVLVYGGATASGTFAIQLLKLQVDPFHYLTKIQILRHVLFT